METTVVPVRCVVGQVLVPGIPRDLRQEQGPERRLKRALKGGRKGEPSPHSEWLSIMQEDFGFGSSMAPWDPSDRAPVRLGPSLS